MSVYNTYRIGGASKTVVHVGTPTPPPIYGNARYGAAAAVQLHASSSSVTKASSVAAKAQAEADALQKAADVAKAKAVAANAKQVI